MTREVDILIAGAGPAGLSVGILFARHELRTLVCEQRRLPADKACGEGVMPSGLAHLERLGVRRMLSPADYHPFLGIRYISSRGRMATGVFHEGPGWGIPRQALSRAMHHRAGELKNLVVCDGVRAIPVRRTDTHILVYVGGETVSTRLLVGADGLNSTVRRWAGLQGDGPFIYRWGARQHFSISPWSDFVEVYWGEGAEAYVTPCGKNMTGVAFLWDRRRFSGVRGGDALVPSLLEAFPRLRKHLEGAQPCGLARAVGPMHRIARSQVADGVVLIGDAAGYLDALTGEGISLALAQAHAVEETVAPFLKRPEGNGCLLSARDLSAYQRAYRRIVRPYYRMTGMALFMNRNPRLAAAVIKVLAGCPCLFERILAANMGSG
jgi:flavin-dependent dehydrogenase